MSVKMRILQNQVQCHRCGSKPYSASVHDFRSCDCGAICVDGGLDYIRRVGDIHAYTDLSISLPHEAVEAALAQMKMAQESGRNTFGLLCAAMRGLRDNGVVFNEPS